MTSAADPFRHSDAAYVLGALDDADRRAFEAHLDTCPDCRARVVQARSAVDLLAGFTITDVTDVAEPMPDTLLPGLLRAARRERNRRRGLVGGLAAVAAASAAALIVVLVPGSSGPASPAAQVFQSVVATTPVHATAQLVSRGWGTQITLHCRYAKQLETYLSYNLVVVDATNQQMSAGSWSLAPGGETNFVTGTAVPRDEISKLEITKPDGTPILVLNA
jgi:anti-sigma-K factor RskA